MGYSIIPYIHNNIMSHIYLNIDISVLCPQKACALFKDLKQVCKVLEELYR